jgi:hypothetical protein
MRRWILGLTVAAMVVTGSVAARAGVTQSDDGSTNGSTCLYWYDTTGVEQGAVSLCGWVSDYGSGESRSVSASRQVRTCDANGQQCTDGYSEQYNGPANANEFSMDAEAGTASFNIVLAGENDQCVVQATAGATDSYSFADPYPEVFAKASPDYPYAWVKSGADRITVGASTNPSYPSASVSQQKQADIQRSARGSGTACNWVETQAPSDGGWMQQRQDTTSTVYVTPTL